MADKKLDKKQQAQYLYMAGGHTQAQIAQLVGVSERTVHTWVHQYSWNKLRLGAFQAPATIADNLCAQLMEMQNTIAAREPGNRFPTMQEAEVTRKLVTCLEKMKKYPSLAQNMQVLETFRNYIRPVDKEFARQLGNYTDGFLTAKAAGGYQPWQLEYGAETIPPVAPYYEETEDTEDPAPAKPCPDFNTCLHVGNCHYPHCTHVATPEVSVADYTIPSVHFLNEHSPEVIQMRHELNIPATVGAIPGGCPSPCEIHKTAATGSNPATVGAIPGSCPAPCELHKTEATGSNPAIVGTIPCCCPAPCELHKTVATGSNPAIFIAGEHGIDIIGATGNQSADPLIPPRGLPMPHSNDRAA